MAFFNPNYEAEKATQEYIKEQLAAAGQLDKARSTYKKDLSASVIRKNVADIQREVESNLRGDLTNIEVDPYDNTPRKKVSKDKLMSLTQSTYSNKLLEKILKASNRTEVDNANLKFQETVLTHMSSISKSLEQLVTNTTKEKEAEIQAKEKEELALKPTELAKQIAQLSVEGVAKELKTGIVKKLDTTGMGEVMSSFFQQFKEMIQEGSFASTVKNMAQEAAINRLPGPYKNLITQWREDPVKLIQLGINKLAGDRNSVISDLASVFYSGVKPNTTIGRKMIDMKAKANFDNKFYTSVTKIIPEQLYKIVSALEGSPLKQFDWDKQEYVDSMASYAEKVERLEGALTKGVDSIQSALTYGGDDQILKDRSLRAAVELDKDGKVVRDENGRVKLKNPDHIRKIISQLVTSKIEPSDILSLPTETIMNIDSSVGKGMTKSEAYMSINLVKSFVRSLSYEDRLDFFTSIMDAKTAIDQREDDGTWDILSTQDKAAVRAAMTQMTGNAKAWKEKVRNIHSHIIASNWAAIGGSPHAYHGPSMGQTVGSTSTPNIVYPKSGGVIFDPSKWFTNEEYVNMTDAEKAEALDKFRKAKASFSSGTGVDESTFGDAKDIRHKDGATDESTPESKFLIQLQQRYQNGMINFEQFKKMSDNVTQTMSDATAKAKHDADIKRLETAMEYYTVFDKAGLTAQAKAAMMGNTVAFWKAKGSISSPNDLFPYINDKGELDTNKLARFNISFTGSETESVLDHYKREARKRNGSTFGGGLTDSVTKSISRIFGDPRIADKAGYALGGATGLAIGKLFKDQGIVKSNMLGYALGTVGMAAMSMESTKKYMKNIFGPDGDIRRDTGDGKKGYTNKEIFMAKFMQTYLPAIGIGGKAGMSVLKAFSNAGPIGTLIGIPLSIASGVMAGAVGTIALNGLKKTLFKKRDKDDESWVGKFGNFLKELPGVKKFFGLEDDRSDFRIQADICRRFASEQTALAQKAQAEGLSATAKKHEKAARLLTNAADDIIKIDGKTEMDDDVKANTVEQTLERTFKAVGDLINRDDFDAQVESEMEIRDRSQEMGDAASQKYFDADKDMVRRHQSGAAALEHEMASAEKLYSKGERKKDANGNEIQVHMADSKYREKALSGELGKSLQTRARLWEALHSEDTLDKHLYDMLVDYMEANKEATDSATQIFKENGDSLSAILGADNTKDFIAIMDGYNDGSIPKHLAMKRYDELMRKPDVQSKMNDINDLMQAKITQDSILSQMLDFTKAYLSKTTSLSKDEIELRSIQEVKSKLSSMPMNKRLGKRFNEFRNGLSRFLTTYWRGEDDLDTDEYNLFTSMSDFMSAMETSKRHQNDMNIKQNEYDIETPDSEDSGSGYFSGGAQRSKKGRPQPNKSAKMKDFGHIKLKNGESIGEVGCAVTSLYNALLYLGIDPPDITTLSDIANDYITKGGINHNFFAHNSKRLGYKVERVKVENNNVRVILEKNLTKWSRKNQSALIFLLKNVGVDGNHFVTAEGQIGQSIRINDPETNGLETYPIAEIAARVIGIYIITKYEAGKIEKTIMNAEDKIESLKDNFSKKKQRAKDLFDLVSNPKSILSKVGEFLIEDSKFDPVLRDGVVTEKVGQSQDNIFAKMLEKLTKIADNTEEDNKEDVLDVRVTDDLTLPLKSSDSIAARAIARYNAFKSGLSKKATAIASEIKRLTESRDVQHEMKEADKAQDDIAKIAENTSPDNKKKAKTEEVKAGDKDEESSGGIGSILGDLLVADGVKGILKNFKNIIAKGGRIALPLALAGGAAYIGKKGWDKVWEGGKQAWGGLMNLNPFTNKDQNAVVDPESGKVIQNANIYDPTASFRHIRDGVNFATAAANVTKMALNPLQTTKNAIGFAKKLFGGGDKVTKVADLATTGVNKLGNVMKLPDSKLGKLAGGFIKLLRGFFDKLAANKVVGRLIGGNTFMSKVLGKFLPTLEKALPSFLKKAANVMGSKAGATMLKGIPILGQTILLGQAIWSFTTGYRKAHQFLNVQDENAVGTEERIKMAIAKLMYDIGPDLLASLCPPGVSWIALGLVAVLRKWITWDKVVDWLFPKEEREKKRIKAEGTDKTISEVERELEVEEKKNEDALNNIETEEKFLEDYKKKDGVTGDTKLNNGMTVAEYEKDIQTRREQHTKNMTDIAAQKEKLQLQYAKVKQKNIQATAMNEAVDLTAADEAKKRIWEEGHNGRFKHPRGDRNTVITSAFGPRNVGSYASKNHRGIDLQGKAGDPVYAAADGVVEIVSNRLGQVTIAHADGSKTRYMHMQRFHVKPGDNVKAGQLIGDVGNIGANGRPHPRMGAHLHFEVIENGQNVDPFLALGLDPKSFKTDPISGAENIAYLERNKWLTNKATENANKAHKTTSPKEEKGGPEWTADNFPLPENKKFENTIAILQSDNARLTNEVMMLNSKLDQVVTYLSQLVSIVGENSNNFMSEAMAGSKLN